MAQDRYKYFRLEARELLEGLSQGVLDLEKGPSPGDVVARLLRLAHTLKGAARVVRLTGVADLAHDLEDALAPLKTVSGPAPGATVSSILSLLDAVGAAIGVIDPAEEPVPGSVPTPVPTPVQTSVPTPVPEVPGSVSPNPEAVALTAHVPAAVPQAVTLTASAQAAVPQVPFPGAPTRAVAVQAAADPAGPAPEPTNGSARRTDGPPTRPAPQDAVETVRVEIREMDVLLEGISEAAVQIDALGHEAAALERVARLVNSVSSLLEPKGRSSEVSGTSLARARSSIGELRSLVERLGRELINGLSRTDREVRQVRTRANWLRLVPAGSIFGQVERATRDAAQTLGKRVAFSASGGDSRLDGHVLMALRDALLHVVRNSVAHGIESEADRLAAGKAEIGTVRLTVERRGNRVAFICQDDGRGIDLEAVRNAAVKNGLIGATEAAGMSHDAVAKLIFLPGLSTSRDVNAVSGRGVGLDVVRDVAASLKGDVFTRSHPGGGTTVEIEVPVSLSSISALMVEAADRTVFIPLDAVERTLRSSPADIASTGDGESLLFDGAAIPFLALDSILSTGGRGQAKTAPAWSTVILHSGTHRVAVTVNHLRGTPAIVRRPLPRIVAELPLGAGAARDAEGNPIPVLDPRGLVEAARSGKKLPPAVTAEVRAPILVIDDSLTTRMMEQSILESAGYEVDLAVSAEEALDKSRVRQFALFVVDIEMPGMNGIEFVARTRSDAALRGVPAILVSSLSSDEDKRRGLEAGALAYIVKGEFAQGRFLKTIREALG